MARELEDIASYCDADHTQVQISEKKFKAELRKAFRLFDANHNNMLEKDELAAMLRSMGRRPLQSKIDSIFDTLDVDGNGSLDFAEFCTYFKEHHAPLKGSAMDTSKEEKEEAVKKVANKKVADKRKRDPDTSASAQPTPTASALEAFTSGDVDPSAFAHSERLFRQQMRQVFNLLDKNGDNKITKSEVMTTLKKMDAKPKKNKVDAIFVCCDRDNKGSIDFEEFCKYFNYNDIEEEPENPAKRTKQR